MPDSCTRYIRITNPGEPTNCEHCEVCGQPLATHDDAVVRKFGRDRACLEVLKKELSRTSWMAKHIAHLEGLLESVGTTNIQLRWSILKLEEELQKEGLRKILESSK